MEMMSTEIRANDKDAATTINHAVLELSEMQLAFVGGGNADVILA